MRFCWQGGLAWQRAWMERFGRLVYSVERAKKVVAAADAAAAQDRRRQRAQQPSLPAAAHAEDLRGAPRTAASSCLARFQTPISLRA
jgi:hypothetical protein